VVKVRGEGRMSQEEVEGGEAERGGGGRMWEEGRERGGGERR
jgi:hypothetical protein